MTETENNHKGPGNVYHNGITLMYAVSESGNATNAKAWFIERCSTDGIRCPHCDSDRISARQSQADAVPLPELPQVFQRPHRNAVAEIPSCRSPSGRWRSICTAPT